MKGCTSQKKLLLVGIVIVFHGDATGSWQGESCDDVFKPKSTQGGFSMSVLMGLTPNAKGFQRAACRSTFDTGCSVAEPCNISSVSVKAEVGQKEHGSE